MFESWDASFPSWGMALSARVGSAEEDVYSDWFCFFELCHCVDWPRFYIYLIMFDDVLSIVIYTDDVHTPLHAHFTRLCEYPFTHTHVVDL